MSLNNNYSCEFSLSSIGKAKNEDGSSSRLPESASTNRNNNDAGNTIPKKERMTYDVYLGRLCDQSTWKTDVAIPLFHEFGTTDDNANLENFVIENKVLKGVCAPIADFCNIGELILKTFDSDPNHVAQIDAATGEQTTFAEMRDLSVRCALWLGKQGIGRGDIITLCTPNHLDTYIPFLGIFLTGAVFNAWEYNVDLKSARQLMQLIQPKIMFAFEKKAEILLEAAKLENVNVKIIVFEKFPGLQSLWDLIREQTDEDVKSFRPREIKDPDETGFILMSSGSSGFPKGVVHPYKNLFKAMYSFTPCPMTGIALWYSTCTWISGFSFTLMNIVGRGTRIIHSSSNAEEICRVIDKFKVERIFLSPNATANLCKSNVLKKYKLDSVQYITIGGCKIGTRILDDFRKSLPKAYIGTLYGMSESARLVTTQTKNFKKINSAGIVNSSTQIKIIDVDSGRTLGPNELGELCVKSIAPMSGYYKNEEITKETIDDEGWIHSGDSAYYDEKGEIFIVDRLKEMMKYQIQLIAPAEIEEVLLSHPDVIEVSVVPVPHDNDGNRPMAFVKKVPMSKVTEEELVELSATSGEIKKLRGGVIFLEELPKTCDGKIARPCLKEMAKALADNIRGV